MTFTITETQVYLGIILILLVMQVYHQTQIKKLEKEVEKLWNQIAVMATVFSMHLAAKDNQTEKQDIE